MVSSSRTPTASRPVGIRVSDSLGGDDVKFADYLLSVGEKLYEPEWPKGRIPSPKMRIELDVLVDRFPYPRKGAA